MIVFDEMNWHIENYFETNVLFIQINNFNFNSLTKFPSSISSNNFWAST